MTEVETRRRSWISVVEDAGDGSGDAIVPVPDELLAELGWDENTELEVSVENGGIMVREIVS